MLQFIIIKVAFNPDQPICTIKLRNYTTEVFVFNRRSILIIKIWKAIDNFFVNVIIDVFDSWHGLKGLFLYSVTAQHCSL